MQVLACVSAAKAKKGKTDGDVKGPAVHVYGFNWSGKHWVTHQV